MSVPVEILAQAPASSPGSAARSMHTSAPAPVPAQVETSPAPSSERSRNGSPGSGSGSKESKEPGSGSGILPTIPGIAWERHAKGGVEAWHGSPGAPRKERTYIAYLNPKRMEGPPDEIERLVRTKAAGKGIQL